MREFKTINVSLTPRLLERVDRKRKDMPRSRFVVRALEAYLGVGEKEATKYE